MKKFLKTLAQHGVELRLAFSGSPSKSVSAEQIKEAAERLDQEWDEEELTVKGTFRGLIRESAVFDLIADSGLITGTVSEALTEEDFDRISDLTNLNTVAQIQKNTFRQVGGGQRVTYVLLDAKLDSIPTSDDETRN